MKWYMTMSTIIHDLDYYFSNYHDHYHKHSSSKITTVNKIEHFSQNHTYIVYSNILVS